MTSEPKKKSKHPLSYTGLAYQLVIFLTILAFIGSQIDKKMGFEKAYVTAGLLLFGTTVYLYKIVKQIS